MKKIFALSLALILALSLAACGGKKSTTLKVAASPTPHAEILNQCVDILKEQGIELVVTEYSDYVVPNTAVEDGDEDANYFQHVPYLDDFNAERGTHLVSVAGVHVEPMGLYAGKSASLDAIPDGGYDTDNMKSTVVPFRNGIMLSVACGLAESRGLKHVLIANHGGDHAIYPDCRRPFVEAMDLAMREGTYINVSILAPYTDITKADIVARGSKLGVNYADTYSCYKGGERHCGTCGTCTERKEAFAVSGVPDPTSYE